MPALCGAKERNPDRSILAWLTGGLKRTMKGLLGMSKRELIDCICEINTSAKPEFLANFSEEDLKEYLEHLMELDLEELALCS